MTELEIKARLAMLRDELPGLEQAEEGAAVAMREAAASVEEIEAAHWAGRKHADFQSAVQAWRQAVARHGVTAERLEGNWRRAGLLRRQLEAARSR